MELITDKHEAWVIIKRDYPDMREFIEQAAKEMGPIEFGGLWVRQTNKTNVSE